jgi:TonB family protein
MLVLAGACVTSLWAAGQEPQRTPWPRQFPEADAALAASHDYVLEPDEAPKILKNPIAEYPESAWRKCVEGVVWVVVAIDPEGRVVHAQVAKSIPELDYAALSSVKNWRFKPARKAGIAVGTVVEISLMFQNHAKTPETCGQGQRR